MADINVNLKLDNSKSQLGGESKSDKTISNFLPKTGKSMLKMVGVLGGIAASVSLLSGASQSLKGTLEIFKRAFQLVLKPIGDFVSLILRPLAILLLKWVKDALKIKTKEDIEKQKVEAGKEITSGDVGTTIKGIGDYWDAFLNNMFSKVDATSVAEKLLIELMKIILELPILVAQGLWMLGKAAFDVGYALGEILTDAIINPYLQAVYETWSKLFDVISNGFNTVVELFQTYILKPFIDFFSNFFENISNISKNVVDWIKNNIITPITTFFKSLFEEIGKVKDKVVSWVNDNLFNPIKEFFNKIKEAIMNYVNNLISFFGGGKSKSEGSESVSDAIISPSGKVITTDPKDYLIATKNPGELLGSSGKTNNINISVNIEKVDSDARIRELAQKISEEISRSVSYISG